MGPRYVIGCASLSAASFLAAYAYAQMQAAAAPATAPAADAAAVRRYQSQLLQVGNDPILYIVDTATGEVWSHRYEWRRLGNPTRDAKP